MAGFGGCIVIERNVTIIQNGDMLYLYAKGV